MDKIEFQCHFNSSVLNKQPSDFWWCCEFFTYPFVMLKLIDAVTFCCCMHLTGNNLQNSFGPKVVWISVALAQWDVLMIQ